MSARQALGIDIGGSGIKGAVVDVDSGELVTDRERRDTPQPATPDSVAGAVGEVVTALDFAGPCGLTLPGVILGGVARTAVNLGPGWVGSALPDVFRPRLPGPAVFLNDADAAGLAEVRFGAGEGRHGLVVIVTLGTGIGTALVHDGQLVPNAELGHIEIDGHDAETRAAGAARKRDDLDWETWAGRVTRYLTHLENLIWPELFILGGGVSKKPERWLPYVKTRTPIELAVLRNNAGIIGAALLAHELTAG